MTIQLQGFLHLSGMKTVIRQLVKGLGQHGV